MFGLFRSLRRRKFLRKEFPQEWIAVLRRCVPFFSELPPELRAKFLDRTKIFVWEIVWIEAGGMKITDEVRVVIAAAATRLALHLSDSVYNRLTEIVVYPSHYHHPDDDAVVFGEAHQWGTVVLSWDAVVGGLANPHDGHDTATHEFAHVLDRGNGQFNGTPELRAGADYRPWAMVLGHHFDRLRKNKRPERQVLREYGATNEAEFFAVATEAFFEKPERMLEETPDLYEELSRFYGFDPAAPSKS